MPGLAIHIRIVFHSSVYISAFSNLHTTKTNILSFEKLNTDTVKLVLYKVKGRGYHKHNANKCWQKTKFLTY